MRETEKESQEREREREKKKRTGRERRDGRMEGGQELKGSFLFSVCLEKICQDLCQRHARVNLPETSGSV